MADAFIYDAVRTPRGKGRVDGGLHDITPIQLATQVLQGIRDRNNLDTNLVDDVILGCVSPVGEQGSDIARVAALNADFDEDVPGVQVNRFCASGLEAVNMASGQVMAGQTDLMIAGGVESMSRVKMGSDGGAMATDPQVAFKTYFVPQGISADLIATKYGYSRDDVDAFAVESQKRTKQAWDEGRFSKSILPVKDQVGMIALDKDEHPRPETDMQSLASLKASFVDMGEAYGFDAVALLKYPEYEQINHVHTAGNSSGIVDGAAAVLIGSKQMGKKLGLTPRAKIKAYAAVGTEPTIMLTGPSFSAEKALKRAKMSKNDIDLYEVNEAFSAVVLRFMDALGVDHSKVNVNGGAIAMGHPLGATGAMILGTVLDELERTGKGTALATLCVGAGMGVATIIERV
jgi:acetyl-CoA C-acetyltransferase